MSDCRFYLLASFQAEVSVVYEDERTVTFMDIQPAVRGDMIIVPRRHAAFLADLGDGFEFRFSPNNSVRPRIELDQAATALARAWPV